MALEDNGGALTFLDLIDHKFDKHDSFALLNLLANRCCAS